MSDPIGLTPSELQRRALRGVTWSTASSIVALPMAMAVSVILARSLDPQQFARFAYLIFLVPLLLALTDLGYAQATTREASRAFAAGDLARTRELVGKALGWNLLRLPLVTALTLAVVRPGGTGVLLLLGGFFFSAASAGLVFSLNAEARVASMAKLSFVQAVAAAVSSSAAALGGASGTTVFAVSLVSGSVAVPGFLLAANPSLRRAALTPRLPRGLPAGFWRFGVLSLAGTLGTLLVFSRSEVVILELLGEQQALAVFALAFGLAQRLTTPVDTLLGPLVPTLSALEGAHPERLRAGFERALRLAFAAVAFLAGAAVVGTALAAPILYGSEYRGVGAAFVALAVVSLLRAAAQPYTALVYALGRPGIILRALAVALVADVAVALALIPPFGLAGAVLANAVGALVALGLVARAAAGAASVRVAGVRPTRLLTLVSASSVAAYAAGLLVGQVHPAAGALAAFAVGTSAFVLLARAAGGVVPAADAVVLLEAIPARLGRAGKAAAFVLRPAPSASSGLP